MTKRRRTGGDLGKQWFDRTGAQSFFWGNVCRHRPDCWRSLRDDVLPAWAKVEEAGHMMMHAVLTSAADAPDEARADYCEYALGTIPAFEETRLARDAAIRSWQLKWNLTVDWLLPWVDVTLETLEEGADPPWPLNGRRLLPPDAGLLEETRAVRHYRKRAPDELRLDFSEWALLPYGETIPQARSRIRKAFNAKLDEYLRSVEEWVAHGRMATFSPDHFPWVVRRLIPPVERCEDIAASPYAKAPFPDHAASQVDRSEVSRQTLELARFLGLPKFPRPRPVV